MRAAFKVVVITDAHVDRDELRKYVRDAVAGWQCALPPDDPLASLTYVSVTSSGVSGYPRVELYDGRGLPTRYDAEWGEGL
jgi:hypothetical protein